MPCDAQTSPPAVDDADADDAATLTSPLPLTPAPVIMVRDFQSCDVACDDDDGIAMGVLVCIRADDVLIPLFIMDADPLPVTADADADACVVDVP